MTSLLTDYGTIITEKTFLKVKDTLKITKFVKFNKKTFVLNQYRRKLIEGVSGHMNVYYRIPRCILTIGKVSINEPEQVIDDTAAISVHKYQDLVINRIQEELAGKHSMMLQMDTGLGKSFVAAELICRLKYRTCIIVPKKGLAIQMKEDLLKAFKSAKESFIYPDIETSKKKMVFTRPPADKTGWAPPSEGPEICILVINTAAKMDSEFFANFGLIIYDEVHAYCADSFSEIFWVTDTAKYTLGMTATPDRIDGMELLLKIHLGPTILAEDIYGPAIGKASAFTGTVRKVEYYGPKEFTKTMTSSTGLLSTILMAKQFLEDPLRMALAADILCKLYRGGHDIYVFCQTKDPLTFLKDRLLKLLRPKKDTQDSQQIGVDDIFVVTGDTTTSAIEEARTNARIFLTTYSLSSTGLSLPRFTALILLTPMKSNSKQIVGRIFRKGSDESIERVVVDIVDMNTSLKRQWSTRKIEYARRGLKMTSESWPSHASMKTKKEIVDTTEFDDALEE
jgi:superfamily II DNA or RNA helicase